ncbi:hypothetical protein C8J57DRAFT_1301694 [Mycena rebaudengoi]|nr:hypothetical protein C8J57DRAFT_1301694 [Mycena rebaudengoi]
MIRPGSRRKRERGAGEAVGHGERVGRSERHERVDEDAVGDTDAQSAPSRMTPRPSGTWTRSSMRRTWTRFTMRGSMQIRTATRGTSTTQRTRTRTRATTQETSTPRKSTQRWTIRMCLRMGRYLSQLLRQSYAQEQLPYAQKPLLLAAGAGDTTNAPKHDVSTSTETPPSPPTLPTPPPSTSTAPTPTPPTIPTPTPRPGGGGGQEGAQAGSRVEVAVVEAGIEDWAG